MITNNVAIYVFILLSLIASLFRSTRLNKQVIYSEYTLAKMQKRNNGQPNKQTRRQSILDISKGQQQQKNDGHKQQYLQQQLRKQQQYENMDYSITESQYSQSFMNSMPDIAISQFEAIKEQLDSQMQNNNQNQKTVCPNPHDKNSLINQHFYLSVRKLEFAVIHSELENNIEKGSQLRPCQFTIFCRQKVEVDFESLLVALDKQPTPMYYKGELSSDKDVRQQVKSIVDDFINRNRADNKDNKLDCGCKNRAPFVMQNRFLEMSQIIRLKEEYVNQKYSRIEEMNRMEQFVNSKYYFILQRIVRHDQTFSKMDIETGNTYECYISNKKNNGLILGRDLGMERFGTPYDYFRSGFIVPQTLDENVFTFSVYFNVHYQQTTSVTFMRNVMVDASERLKNDCDQSKCKLAANLDRQYFETEMVRVFGQSKLSEELKTMLEFERYFEEKYGEQVDQFMQSTDHTLQIDQYCAQLHKIVKYVEMKFNETTWNVTYKNLKENKEQTEERIKTSLTNEQIFDSSGKINEQVYRIKSTKDYQNSIVQVVVYQSRSCLVGSIFGPMLQE